MPINELAGQSVNWRVYGQGQKPALLIHCSLAHSGAWRGMMPCLDDVFVAKAFDLPGHGKSGDWGGQVDFQTRSCEIAWALVDGPVHLIGHSFGATIALRMAVERPEMVKSITLIEPVLFAAAKGRASYDQYMTDFLPFVDAIEAGDREAAAAAFSEMWGTGQDWTDISKEQREEMVDRIHLIPAGNTAIFDDAAGVLEPGRLEALEIPVLLIEGTRSPPIVSEIMNVLQSRIAQSRRVKVSGAAHMVPITHPKQVADAIRELVDAARG